MSASVPLFTDARHRRVLSVLPSLTVECIFSESREPSPASAETDTTAAGELPVPRGASHTHLPPPEECASAAHRRDRAKDRAAHLAAFANAQLSERLSECQAVSPMAPSPLPDAAPSMSVVGARNTTRQQHRPVAATATAAAAVGTGALQALYSQVVKEASFCFMVLEGQQSFDTTADSPSSNRADDCTGAITAASAAVALSASAAKQKAATATLREKLVRYTVHACRTAVHEEQAVRTVVEALRASPPPSDEDLPLFLSVPALPVQDGAAAPSPARCSTTSCHAKHRGGDSELLGSHKVSSSPALPAGVAMRRLLSLPSVPLTRWCGWCHYAYFLSTKAAAAASSVAAPRTQQTPLQATAADHNAACERHAEGPAGAVVPFTLASVTVQWHRLGNRDAVAAEVAAYWRLHEETAARARLRALRSNDTEGFAAHVSLLKISTLLSIMEKTHQFMAQIGMQLKTRADAAAAKNKDERVPSTAATSLKAGATARAVLDAHASLASGVAPSASSADCTDVARGVGEPASASSDYLRFKAYVDSTKDDFRLVHQVDVFVASQPCGLRATLLPHQMDGLRFLASLHANGINGILADEMGVGKTIQTLAFLLYLKASLTQTVPDHASPQARQDGASALDRGPCTTGSRPHLVLAPLSVVREWREACETFAPDSLRVAEFLELDEPAREAVQYDVVLLPIHSARLPQVQQAASCVHWGYLVVDEAHKAVSNLATQTARAISSFPYTRRLVLTGTPLNSDLQELWSLLHFLNPSVFTSADSFEEVFRRPFAKYNAQEMELSSEERGLLVLRLHQILRPFMLRRTKGDVDHTLRMTSHTVRAPITAMQRELLSLLRVQRRTPTVTTSPVGSSDSDEECDSSSSSSQREGEVETERSQRSMRSSRERAAVRSPCPVAAGAAAGIDHAHAQLTEARRTVTEKHSGNPTAMRRRVHRVLRCCALTGSGVSTSTAQLLCNHAFLLPFFSRVLRQCGLSETTAGYGERGSVRGSGRTGSDAGLELPVSPPKSVEPAAEGHHACAPVGGGAADAVLACSGKFLVLHLLLSRLVLAKRKAVIFTHWLDCVDLLAEYLAGRGWSAHAEVLTGDTAESERKARVKRFRDDDSCLFFLLSVKAGGCGINLQTAHIVMLLDRDYTSTNEDQALARVFRIGQQHTVRALYFTTDDAAEARVVERAERKNKPRLAIIEDGHYQVGHQDGDEENQNAAAAMTASDSEEANRGGESTIGSSCHSEADDTDGAENPLGADEEPCPHPQEEEEEEEEEERNRCTDTVSRSRKRSRPRRRGAPAANTANPSTSQADSAPLADLTGAAELWSAMGALVTNRETMLTAPAAAGERDLCRGVCVGEFSGTLAALTDAHWEALRRLVEHCDALVLTEEDDAQSPARVALEAHRPPRTQREFEQQWQRARSGARRSASPAASTCGAHELQGGTDEREACTATTEPQTPAPAAVSSVCSTPATAAPDDRVAESIASPNPRSVPPSRHAEQWAEVWQLWFEAIRGPPLLAEALRRAVHNAAKRDDPEHQRRRRERRAQRQTEKLSRLIGLAAPPESWMLECWERGIEDDDEISRLYADHIVEQTQKAEQRAQVRAAAQAAREARRQEKERRARERSQAAAERKRAREKRCGDKAAARKATAAKRAEASNERKHRGRTARSTAADEGKATAPRRRDRVAKKIPYSTALSAVDMPAAETLPADAAITHTADSGSRARSQRCLTAAGRSCAAAGRRNPSPPSLTETKTGRHLGADAAEVILTDASASREDGAAYEQHSRECEEKDAAQAT